MIFVTALLWYAIGTIASVLINEIDHPWLISAVALVGGAMLTYVLYLWLGVM